jgi:hypothetical protein
MRNDERVNWIVIGLASILLLGVIYLGNCAHGMG